MALSLHSIKAVGVVSRPQRGAQRPLQVATPPPRPVAAAGGAGGFGASNKKKAETKGSLVIPEKLKRADEEVLRGSSSSSSSSSGDAAASTSDYISIANVSDFAFKQTKPVITASGIQLMLYKWDGRVYCSDAASTAYQFPMVDAKLSAGPNGAVHAEVPLDGTIYDLRSGAVVEWCPKKGGLLRSMLGSLKEKTSPTPIKVYPTQVQQDGSILVKLV